MKLDPVNHACSQECAPEEQIYNPDLEQCDMCNATCSKCRGDTNYCTECKPDFVLNLDNSCQDSCNDETQTPVKQICMFCEEPCYSCLGSVSNCMSCIQEPTKHYLLKSATSEAKCVQYCPMKYEVDAAGLECVYVGLVCPENYKIDRSGDKCVPIIKECAAGYDLNEENTACVPEPGSPLPFPFLIAALFLALLVLSSYLKEKFFTKVLTCLVCFIGVLELPIYFLMVVFAAREEEWAAFTFSLIGLFALVFINGYFLFFYKKDICANDTEFRRWLYFFPKVRSLMPFLLLVNFKCSKVLHSGFYGQEATLAKFTRPHTLMRLLNLCSQFSFIFVYLPIFLADCVVLVRVRWGS